jgi:signal transduction histidine kinase/CheY-like chemotaxis protein
MTRSSVAIQNTSLPTTFASELRISPKPLIVILAVAGWMLIPVHEFFPHPEKTAWYALLILALCAVTWLLLAFCPRWGELLTILMPISLVLLAHGWLGIQGLLPLLAFPVVWATAQSGFSTAVLVAAGETVSLLLYASIKPGLSEVGITILAIWATAGALYAIYRPLNGLQQWLYEYFKQAQDALEEARDRRTELEQANVDLAHANRQLALANERMVAMRVLAEEAQKSKAAFVAKVSHEFRTPLNMIIGLMDLLVEKPEVYGDKLPLALLDDLDIVRHNCEHLSAMINDVLDLSQAEAGHLALHKERVNLAHLITDAVTVVRPLLEKKRLDVRLAIPSDLPQVYCDPTRIRQVILNLVSNAARFTEAGGITVAVAQLGEYVTVNVIDTGPGIAPEDTKRVFEPFWQGTRVTLRDRGGSGLGLSISKQFVELQGGRIWLESEVGIGTTFSFNLPISPPLEAATGPTRWLSESWEWIQGASRSDAAFTSFKKRLVVYDQSGEIHALAGHYSDDVEIVDTQSLAQVVQEIHRCPAHAVVLNAETPELLWPLITSIKQEIPGTPIVGCALPSRAKHALAAGAVDLLVKPVTRANLARVMQGIGEPIQRVLVVDDDPHVQQLFARMLFACDSSIKVATASQGLEALSLLHTFSPDLVLLDLLMPDMDGWQVLDAKGQDEAIKDIPVVLISAQDPSQQPLASPALIVTIDKGLSSNQVWNSTRWLSSLLLEPE